MKEGEAFLETQGKVHDDAKTRAQQKQKEENANCEEAEGEDSPNKLSRTTTMAATAKVPIKSAVKLTFALFLSFIATNKLIALCYLFPGGQ